MKLELGQLLFDFLELLVCIAQEFVRWHRGHRTLKLRPNRFGVRRSHLLRRFPGQRRRGYRALGRPAGGCRLLLDLLLQSVDPPLQRPGGLSLFALEILQLFY